MRTPFKRLGFERKIAMLPVFAAVGLAVTLWVTVAVGARNQDHLALLRDGYGEALETSRDLESLLESYRRTIQDAVAAEDRAALFAADSLAHALVARLSAARANPVADTARLSALQHRFEIYHVSARDVATDLIEGTPVDSVISELVAVGAQFRGLHDDLVAGTERERSRIDEAHDRVEGLGRSATVAIIVVLLIVVTALTVLARLIEQEVRASLSAIARAASHIANGDLRRGFDFGAQVELDQVAKPFRAICDYIEGIAAAADRLAKGDLSVTITPRSDRDLVAVSLRQAIVDRIFMEEALRHGEEHRQAVKMEAIGRLAGGIAHDFNNLLTAIQGHATLLAESLGPEHDGQEELAEVRRSADRAASLTRQLLAYSSKQVLHPKLVDLNVVIRDVSRMLRRMIREDIELRQELGEGLGAVRIDPTQMEQVILNLVLNARDAMPHGGTITLRSANTTLDAVAGRKAKVLPGEYVVLRVEDTGVGMDEQTCERIFEPFFTTKQSTGGTGLGLATVYGIVRQSGGDVQVESEPGRGTAFVIHLPRDPEALLDHADPATAVEPRASCRGSEVALVVEDEPAVRRMVVKVLEQRGYTVLEAGNGIEALDVADAHDGQIDVLLTDVVMPQMGGRELADSLVARRPELRVVYMSGYSEDTVLQREVFMPGARFLEKPFTPSALADKVREVLDATAGDDAFALTAPT
jgi:signal transduction histidine kinase/CheY-like chemotaxis protein